MANMGLERGILTCFSFINTIFAMGNNYLGTLLAGVVVIPAVYYSNMYYTGYLPINSSRLFTNTGEEYSVEQVLTNNILDNDKYQQYSPPYYTAANLVVYGAFCFIPSSYCSYISILSRYFVEWAKRSVAKCHRPTKSNKNIC